MGGFSKKNLYILLLFHYKPIQYILLGVFTSCLCTSYIDDAEFLQETDRAVILEI